MSANLFGIGRATNYAKNEQDFGFRVFINTGELNQIHEWVRKHNSIETGGDLFGLWIDEHTAVVQFVLGPGKGCRRYPTSFFQDVSYLKNAGSYLTKAHGLCNIGQWHSHHRIPLFKPSAGDDNTVWNNMSGLGLDRYIVFIANITNTVEVNCFLYQIKNGRELPVTLGKFHELDANSPFRLNENLLQHIYTGAENFNQIPVFEKEKPKIVNNDAKKALNISAQNESRTENYTRNIVQKTSVASGGRVNSHNPNPLTDKSNKTKELEKWSTPRNTATIYRIPEPERHRIKNQTKRLDTPQNIQSQETITVKNKEKMTKNDQNTSGISDGLQKALNSHNKTVLEDKTKKRDKNQSGVSEPQVRKQQEHTKRTPPTTQRGSENHHTPSTPQITQKGRQIDNEKYDAISRSCQHKLQNQNTAVSYIESKGVVPVKQQEPDSTIITPRITSDECDNATVNFEKPQFKAYRSNAEVSEDLATVAERPSTQSGTFSSHDIHDEGEETEENCDVGKRTRRWTDFMCTWICHMFKALSIGEPDSKERKRKKKTDDGSVRKKNNRKRLKVNLSKRYPDNLRDVVMCKSPEPMPNWTVGHAPHTRAPKDGFLRICHWHWACWTRENMIYQVFKKGEEWLEPLRSFWKTGYYH